MLQKYKNKIQKMMEENPKQLAPTGFEPRSSCPKTKYLTIALAMCFLLMWTVLLLNLSVEPWSGKSPTPSPTFIHFSTSPIHPNCGRGATAI